MERTGKRIQKYAENYVVFDLETTGISAVKDDIIEISAIKVKNHKPIEEFSMLVNPGRHIPAGATAVNGITDDMVRDLPGLSEILPDFLSFIGNEILVGHNIHTFDLKFIYRETEALFQKTIANDYVDTLYMARKCLPQLAHHRLTDVSSYFQIATEGAHRALNDCIMNQQCYEMLGKMLGEVKEEVCPKCGGELTKRSGKFGSFYGCSNYPSCRFTKNI